MGFEPSSIHGLSHGKSKWDALKGHACSPFPFPPFACRFSLVNDPSCLHTMLHREKGRGSTLPAHRDWRHTNDVNTTMLVPASSVRENVRRLGQPRTSLRITGIIGLEVQVRGFNHVINTSLPQDRTKSPLHQAGEELKAGKSHESVVTNCAHRCATSRAYGSCREHMHALALPQECVVVAPNECLLQPQVLLLTHSKMNTNHPPLYRHIS